MGAPTGRPTATIFLWPGRFLMLAPAVKNAPHRHPAASILVGLERPFSLRIERQAPRPYRAVLVAPNVRQSLDSLGGAMLVVHMDPDLPVFRTLLPRLADEPVREAHADIVCPALPASCAEAQALFERAIAAFGSGAAAQLDPRIATLVASLRADLPETLDVASLARAAHLSSSRLMHLFKRELGVPLRRFVLNLRLQAAMRHWQPGMTLARLAVEAGFYDQPHMVRTARETFDALPSHYADPEAIAVHRCGA